MNRTGIFLSLSALSAAVVSCGEKQKIPQQPNIIYILADDLGYGELGCYGQKKIETPNIDRLAANGMRFTQHYSGSPVSAPTRCTVFTGLHTGHAYIRTNDQVDERGYGVQDYAVMLADSSFEGQRPMPANTITFPQLLQNAGYTTGIVGKWGLGYPGSESTPNRMGFDFFYGYNCQGWAHTYYPPFLNRNEQREYLPNELIPPHSSPLDEGADPYDEKSYAKYTQQVYSPDLMYDEIIQFVEENKDRPFFLAWTTTLPHVALQAPERWVNYYREKFGDEEPYTGSGYFPCRYPRATYAAMISYLDEQIGGLVAKLKESGIYENTIIMFTSDNGPAWNAGADPDWFDSAQPFNGGRGWGKGSVHEGGIRVPLTVTWEGVIKPDTQSDHISATWDVMATICEIANMNAPENDGISFVPELLGKKQKAHEYLYWEYPDEKGEKAVRMGKWKSVILDFRKNGDTNLMLFDLEADPQEQNDIASRHPDIVQTMRKVMSEAHVEPPLKQQSFEGVLIH